MSTELNKILEHPAIWRGNVDRSTSVKTVSTGYADLDAALPGGGWPLGNLIELLFDEPGTGELSLLMPLLKQQTQDQENAVLAAPPATPYAAAFAQQYIELKRLLWVPAESVDDMFWTLHQVLKSPACGVAMGWIAADQQGVKDTALRHIQLAAEQGGGCAFLLRPAMHAQTPSPAVTRLLLRPVANGLSINIIKARGMSGQRSVQLALY